MVYRNRHSAELKCTVLGIVVVCGCSSAIVELVPDSQVHIDLRGVKMFCAYGSGMVPELVGVYPSTSTGQEIVDEVLRVAASHPILGERRFDIYAYRDPNIKNAAATISSPGQRIILYDGRWTSALRNKFSKWAARGVFAHEVGHHFHWDASQKHVESVLSSKVASLASDNRNWLRELEADAYAGVVLALMKPEKSGAVHMMDAFDAMGDGESSESSHPPTHRRRKALHLGWKLGGGAAYSRKTDWCPCGCYLTADGKYFEDYEATDDSYNDEALIYKRREPPPVIEDPDADGGTKRASRRGYKLVPVPCRHEHPMNPKYKLHPYDQVKVPRTGGG